MLNARKKSTVKRVARALKKASRSHAGQAKKLDKSKKANRKKKKCWNQTRLPRRVTEPTTTNKSINDTQRINQRHPKPSISSKPETF